MKIVVINGPNLNLLGTREPSIYGTTSLSELETQLAEQFPGLDFRFFQSNHEGQIIDWLHKFGFSADGIILNPGAFAHTSLALADAVRAITSKVVEVHLSNVFARETFRHNLVIAPHCLGTISGFGIHGYKMAVHYLIDSNN